MFQRLSTGWSLAKQSINVLKLDKELLLFPFLSGLACLLVLASFAVPIVYSGFLEGMQDNAKEPVQQAIMYVGLFLFYFINYFIITFFNAALISCAVIRLKGGDPTVSDGFHFAISRLPQIAGWALVSATVGMILKIIESRSERAGQIVSGLLGMAWSITTFFVVPVLVVEGLGPLDGFKRSVAIMKKTWGESLGANWGIGFIVFLLSLAGILPIVAGGVLIANEALAFGITLVVIGVIILLIIGLISSALNTIILAALYIYASEDQMPQGFDTGMVRTAFATR